MKPGPFNFVRTTTFRLALLYSVLFALFSAALLGYLFQATVGAMRTEAKVRLESEFRTLANAWNSGGPRRLEQSLLERSLVQVREFTYQFETASGNVIVGDMPHMPVAPDGPANSVRSVTFEVERPRSEGAPEITTIEGRITQLPDGSVLLVGIKMDERLRLVNRVTQAVATAAPIGVLLALFGGFFSARYAAGRAEALTRTAEAVMAGDLSERAPVIGSGDEFDRLAERLNAMLSKVESLMAVTRHAGDAIAHDLRSPLSRLRNRLEATLRGPMDEITARETLTQTVDEVDRVLATFNAILRLSRVNAGAEGRLIHLDFSELAEEMAELFEPACEEAGLTFTAEIKSGLSVHGDRALLAQAIANLLDNAIKYTPRGGHISVTAERNDELVDICIRDTGPGIPAADFERVKERFVRLDEARTQIGSGLGLALAEAVADLHGGHLVLSPGSGKPPAPGLQVTLSLPRER
ncbi:MAG: HAMP domain-containing histidine kinase [Alphaproteobacteria bacterium]|nr:HAMP domain-containing histidine kinase [Alphaproteobacteria bacterium]